MDDQYLIFATANQHKLEEIRAMLPGNIQIKSLFDMGFSEDIPETEATLEGNALQKARYIRQRYEFPCFADDTGLEVEALHGAPGVYSARYAGAKGSSEMRSKANTDKLLHELTGASNRHARFRTVIAYIDVEGCEHIFEGIVNGQITEEPAGGGGFGYDPVFAPEGAGATYAQMPLDEKNRISHRAKAFEQFAKALNL